jgi:hypothetical protein
MMSKAEREEELEEAFESLKPFYDEGDDGDAIRMSLNAIAAVIADKARLVIQEEGTLIEVLEMLKADEDLRATIEELYELAQGGGYGDGLSEDAADEINGLLQPEDFEEPLREYIEHVRPKRVRAKLAKKRSA